MNFSFWMIFLFILFPVGIIAATFISYFMESGRNQEGEENAG